MSKKTLHIISLEIPYPPYKGSSIDILNRIKVLHAAGIDIILHAFYKKWDLPEELTKYCKSIYLIPRNKIWDLKSLSLPMYVQSRRSDSMVKILCEDTHPILFEGLHTLFHFDDPRLRHRKKAVRLHNIESEYYMHLSRNTNNPIKKIYNYFESKTSKVLEQKLFQSNTTLFTISSGDSAILSNKKTTHLPPFIENNTRYKPEPGKYALYHGDLSIAENEKAAIFLIDNVFNDIDFPLYISGQNPSNRLLKRCARHSNIKLCQNPATSDMDHLIMDAQLIVLPFFQTAGFKIKLLESMVKGRQIITSANMKKFTELGTSVHFCSDVNDWKLKIKELKNQIFDEKLLQARSRDLDTNFNTQTTLEKLINGLYGEMEAKHTHA